MSSNSKSRFHAERVKESTTIGDPDFPETEASRCVDQYIEDMDDDTAKLFLTTEQASSDTPPKELVKQILAEKLKEFKDNYHFPTDTSSIQDSCIETDAPDCDAKVNNDAMPSAVETHVSSLSRSTASLPMTQITNNGGTININYNLHAAPDSKLNNGKGSTVEKMKGNVHAQSDRDLTSPFGIVVDTPLPKSVSENSASPEDAVIGHTVQHRHEESYEIDFESTLSDIDKAKLKESIDLMFRDSSSRADLSKKLIDFAQAMTRLTCYRTKCTFYVPMDTETDSSSADSDSISPTAEEPLSGEAPFKSSPSPGGSEVLKKGRFELGINAPTACNGESSSQLDVNADDSNKPGARSAESSLLTRNDGSRSPSASIQKHSGDIFKFGTAEPSFKRQVQAEDATSPTLASCSTHVDQDAKLGPALDKISASPPVVTLAASPRKTKKKPRRAAIPRCRLRERENQKNPKDGAVPGLQSVMAQPQGVGNQTNQEPNTEVSNHPTSPIVHPTPARCPPALPATLRSAPETSPSKSLDQKMEKRRSKKPAIQAEQCEGSSGDPANSSADDPAARRAMVLDMLARMAGGPASSADGAQGGGHRDFTFLLPPPAENRKCRLCRNMFTDKSNVKQADGGAPCSFHPGVLEDKTGNNTTYAFSCCGGPPIMVGPNLVAMNLVSPGCTKCYHQDKRSAWDLETLKMRDPVLFEE